MKKLLLLFTLTVPLSISSQEVSKTKLIDHISGSIGITNNGISLVPTFSLGDPAAIFNLKIANKKLSFEPELRFALEGKPWSFLFWFRHQTMENEKFSLRLGAHPALNFRTTQVISNGVESELIETRRYLAAEIVPGYKLAENISLGMYYLISKGFDEGLKNGHFLATSISFSNIPIAGNGAVFLNLTPQFYYLNLDETEGFYSAAFITIAKRKFPITMQSILNKKINSDIDSDDFVWNVSFVYTFG